MLTINVDKNASAEGLRKRRPDEHCILSRGSNRVPMFVVPELRIICKSQIALTMTVSCLALNTHCRRKTCLTWAIRCAYFKVVWSTDRFKKRMLKERQLNLQFCVMVIILLRLLFRAPWFLAFPPPPPLLLFALNLPCRLATVANALLDMVNSGLLLLLRLGLARNGRAHGLCCAVGLVIA
jgi:hypothetical protein